MPNLYIYGGFLFTGGKLDDGKPWKGLSVLLGPIRDVEDTPLKGQACKARQSESLIEALKSIPLGFPVEAFFDIDGRVALVSIYNNSSGKEDAL